MRQVPFQAAPPAGAHPRRHQEHRQAQQAVAPPAAKVELPGEDLRSERERNPDEQRAPGRGAVSGVTHDGEFARQALPPAPLAVIADVVVMGEVPPAVRPVTPAPVDGHGHP